MLWIYNLIVAHRYITSFILTVSLSLYLLQAHPTEQKHISRVLGMTIFLPVQKVVDKSTQLRNSAKENLYLREENTKLRNELSRLKSQLHTGYIENQRTLFQDQFSYELLHTQVVARDASHLYRSAIIDIGSESGVKVNMPVVNHEGVVGKVITALPHSSMVSLLRNTEEMTSILHQKSKSVALLQVESDGSLFAQFRKNTPIQEGDSIVTSGMGGVFPEYLSVGVVERVLPVKESDLFLKVFVQPSVNYEELRDAYVVTLDAEWELYHKEVDSLVQEIQKDVR